MKTYDGKMKSYSKTNGDCGVVKEYKEETVTSTAYGMKPYSKNSLKEMDQSEKELSKVVD